jgi:hypothetical protein
VNLDTLKPGDRVRTADDAVAEVLAASEDGEWIRVKYLRSDQDPELVNTEDLCSADEIEEKISTVRDLPNQPSP